MALVSKALVVSLESTEDRIINYDWSWQGTRIINCDWAWRGAMTSNDGSLVFSGRSSE